MKFPRFDTLQHCFIGILLMAFVGISLTLFILSHRRVDAIFILQEILVETKEVTIVEDEDLRDVFQKRQKHVDQVCSMMRGNLTEQMTNQKAPHPIRLIRDNKIPYNHMAYKFLFADEIHKVLFCSVPKVASTNWKKVLLTITAPENFTDPKLVSNNAANADAYEFKIWPNLRPLVLFPVSEAVRRIETYKKVMWVRNPLERLISAWHSKFLDYNPYYIQIGQEIIYKYRPNASHQEIKQGFPVTFAEFLQYVRDIGAPGRTDVHWDPMHKLCLTCFIDYDFIGKYENLYDESAFVLLKLMNTTNLLFPEQQSHSLATFKQTDLLKGLTSELLLSVLERYKADYEIFDYRYPVDKLTS